MFTDGGAVAAVYLRGGVGAVERDDRADEQISPIHSGSLPPVRRSLVGVICNCGVTSS